MPWTGKSHWTPRHSKRLINVLVAGMLVFVGLQTAASAAPVLKAHRLERSHLPQQQSSASTQVSTVGPDHGFAALYQQSHDHDFVYACLSVCALVTDYTKAQITLETTRHVVHGFHLTGTASPRGPPRTTS
ncbi:hypothetical protein DSM25558_0534 [Agrobacterium sp. DSM 25558]|nr:hypothetical protein DSM25558_0534 [Agrobacterium sp. DSM 25558]